MKYALVTRREEAYAVPVPSLVLAIGALLGDVLGDVLRIGDLERWPA